MTNKMNLKRSQFIIPATDTEVTANASESEADQLIIDLEDSVRPAEKTQAREQIVDTLVENDWNSKLVSCRINSLKTRWWYEDIIDVVGDAGTVLDSIILPKTDSPETITVLDTLLTQVEINNGVEKGSIGIEAQIESAQGMNEVKSIANANARLESLIFGPGDYSVSIGVGGLTTGHSHNYPGHYWHYALSRIVHSAKAAGIQAIDGLYAEFEDEQGFTDSCERAKMLGCDGKWVIHPRQIQIANETFAPSEEEAQLAAEIVEAYEEANQTGAHPVMLNDELIDETTFEMASEIVERAKKAGVL